MDPLHQEVRCTLSSKQVLSAPLPFLANPAHEQWDSFRQDLQAMTMDAVERLLRKVQLTKLNAQIPV
jgi:hypothetical protein